MGQLLQVVQFLAAAAEAGMNMVILTKGVSDLIVRRHAEGKTLTTDDLKGLLDSDDEIEADALKQYNDTLADPNTPKLT
jgi:hypothetical protein